MEVLKLRENNKFIFSFLFISYNYISGDNMNSKAILELLFGLLPIEIVGLLLLRFIIV